MPAQLADIDAAQQLAGPCPREQAAERAPRGQIAPKPRRLDGDASPDQAPAAAFGAAGAVVGQRGDTLSRRLGHGRLVRGRRRVGEVRAHDGQDIGAILDQLFGAYPLDFIQFVGVAGTYCGNALEQFIVCHNKGRDAGL